MGVAIQILNQFDFNEIIKNTQTLITDSIKDHQENRHKWVNLLQEIHYNSVLLDSIKNITDSDEIVKRMSAMKMDAWQEVLSDKNINLKLFVPGRVNRRMLPRVDKRKVDPMYADFLRMDISSVISSVYAKIEFVLKHPELVNAEFFSSFLVRYDVLSRFLNLKERS